MRLLAHARHQEDVVVDPQRHQEDEREQRERRVDCRGSRRSRRTRRAPTPSAAANERITVPISSSGREQRPQQQDQHTKHDDERDRDDHARVARGGLAHVVLDRRRRRPPARSAPPAALGGRAHAGDQVEGLGRVGIGLEHGVAAACPPRPGRSVGTTSATPVGVARSARATARGSPPGGHDHLGRRARAGRERLRRAAPGPPATRRRRGRRWPGSGPCRCRAGRARRRAARRPCRSRSGRGRRADALADPPPGAVGLVRALVAEVRDAVVPEIRAPERAPAADHEQRGQQREHRDASPRRCRARRSGRGRRCR